MPVPTLKARRRAGRRGKLRGGGSEIRTRHVAHVHVVARLQAVAEDRERRAIEEATAEDRDDARFAVRILARTVHVAEAKRARVESVHARVVREYAPRELRDRVRRLGILWRRLAVGGVVEIAVHRATRATRIRRASCADCAHRLEQVQRADDVRVGIDSGIGDALRTSICAARCTITSNAPVTHDRRRLRRAHVELVKARGRRNLRALCR